LTRFDSTANAIAWQKTAMFRAPIACAVLLCVGCRAPEEAPPNHVSTVSEGGSGGQPGDAGGTGGTGGAPGSGGSAPTGNEASVVTYNLESYPLTPDAEAKAVSVIEDLRPDVIALQEIADADAFDALVAALPDYDGVLNDDPGAYLRVGLLWRTERVTVTDTETLFPTDWYAFPRPPLKAHVEIDAATPIDFTAVVLHLKAQLDAESEERRRVACQRLDEWVTAELEASDEQDIVLIGDLNDKVTDPPQWNVFGPFLDHPDRYAFLTLPAAEAGEHTYIPFESFIDHVVVTTDTLDEVGSGQTEVLALETEVPGYRDLTDHRPVRTWLRWEDRP
jgi:endonuclease/exonuclease/phosphatase family metal-dependent hydrolase